MSFVILVLSLARGASVGFQVSTLSSVSVYDRTKGVADFNCCWNFDAFNFCGGDL